ncbi:MAG: hypothetical protein LLG14_27530 [Nocardiaceae bacterium]|nr:hypothetical protein [Nocardiaceae bacterium]
MTFHERLTPEDAAVFQRAASRNREFLPADYMVMLGDARDAQIFGFMARDNGPDCGHINIHAMPLRAFPGYCGGTGYGTDRETGTRKCYACCAKEERASMIATGRATLYIVRLKSEDGKDFDIFTRHVTDWAGELKFRCIETRYHAHAGGFGSQRTDAWFVGPDGFIWHAVNRGDNDIARCKRTRERA